MAKPERVALYLRVSTSGQTVENQRQELGAVAERRGWNVTATYEDAGVSGAKGQEGRSGLRQLLQDARRRRFDRVAVWSIDRFGRSTAQVSSNMVELEACGVSIYAEKEGMDTGTPHGRAMLQMAAVFAELERGMIQERVKAGLVRAKAQGKTLGRPKMGREGEALELREKGLTVRQIAAQMGVSVGLVQKYLTAEHSDSPSAAVARLETPVAR